MISGILGILRSPVVRVGFVLVAVAAAAVAVVQRRDEVADAMVGLPPGLVALSALLGLGYLAITMLCWRALLRDLGSELSLPAAARVFFVSQLGKYLPGGVWNVVAVAEMGADHRIPRSRSVSVMVVATLVSIVTGLTLGVLSVPFAPEDVAHRYGHAVWALPLLAASLTPPVLNRLLDGALRLARRPVLEHPVTARGVAVAVAWSLAAWALAGGHIWLLGHAVGLEASATTLALSTGAYAVAWIAGFLFVVSPAGVGVRELVLGALLTTQLGLAGVVVVVLLSRVVLTAVDVLLGLAALTLGRPSRSPGPAS